jgi:hypothetical protein
MLVPELAEEPHRQREQMTAPVAFGSRDRLDEQAERTLVVTLVESSENLGQLAALRELGAKPLARRRSSELVEEFGNRGRGPGADELGDDASVAERLHRRNALHLEVARELGVRVHVHLGENELSLALFLCLLEHRPEHPAGPAPRGPEVDHDRKLARSLDDVALEGFGCHIHVLYNYTTNRFILLMPLPHPLPEDLVDLMARRFRAIGEPMRIRLLDRLRDGEATVGELAEAIGASQRQLSRRVA